VGATGALSDVGRRRSTRAPGRLPPAGAEGRPTPVDCETPNLLPRMHLPKEMPVVESRAKNFRGANLNTPANCGARMLNNGTNLETKIDQGPNPLWCAISRCSRKEQLSAGVFGRAILDVHVPLGCLAEGVPPFDPDSVPRASGSSSQAPQTLHPACGLSTPEVSSRAYRRESVVNSCHLLCCNRFGDVALMSRYILSPLPRVSRAE